MIDALSRIEIQSLIDYIALAESQKDDKEFVESPI